MVHCPLLPGIRLNIPFLLFILLKNTCLLVKENPIVCTLIGSAEIKLDLLTNTLTFRICQRANWPKIKRLVGVQLIQKQELTFLHGNKQSQKLAVAIALQTKFMLLVQKAVEANVINTNSWMVFVC